MSEPTSTDVQFHCPGEPGVISRAVHRARLAAFYPKCHLCPHRTDAAGFSPKRAERLVDVHAAAPSPALFDEEGISGVLLNQLTPVVARRAGVAFGLLLREQRPEPWWPTVLLAGNGRRATSRLVAAAAEGLRFAGCHVIDAGHASSGCLVFALHQSRADGGLLIGNPGHRPQEAGLRFWVDGKPLPGRGKLPNASLPSAFGVSPGATGVSPVLSDGCLHHSEAPAQMPLSHWGDASGTPSCPTGGTLERLESFFHGSLDRPTRQFGSLARESFEADYLASLADFYHGLRPLVVVLDTPCRPLVEYVHRLSKSLECRFLHDPFSTPETQISEHKAHGALQIDGNGETVRVLDERAEPVPAERFFRLIARHLLQSQEDSREPDACVTPTIVVEEETSAATENALREHHCRIVRTGSGRAEIHRAMEDEEALLGGGPSSRFWYARSGHVSPDALLTLSLLLVILSQSDRPLSRVLDESVAAR